MTQNNGVDFENKTEGSPLSSLSTAHLALIGTVLSLIGGVAGAAINGYFNRDIQRTESEAVVGAEQAKAGGALELERLKFETSLILKALDTPSQPDAVKRLKFFAKAGLIPRYERRVLDLAEEDEGSAVPTITKIEKGQGVPVEPIPPPYLNLSQTIVRLESDLGTFCAGALLRPWHVLTTDFCAAAYNDDPKAIRVRIGGRAGTLVRVAKVIPLGHDSAVLALDGDPKLDLPFLDLSKARDPRQGEALVIIHPYAGGDLVVSQANCVAGTVTDAEFTYKCPTAFGTAGAIIFSKVDLAPLGIVDRFSEEPNATFPDIGVRLSPLAPKITSEVNEKALSDAP